MDNSTWWWLLAVGLVAVELITGTFLLIMLALGAAAGALCAHMGMGLNSQLAAAAFVGALSVAIWYFRQHKERLKQPLGEQQSPDLSLDLGQSVHVAQWHADGTAQVSYRGATWSAKYRPQSASDAPTAGEHRICAMQGNQLVLARI